MMRPAKHIICSQFEYDICLSKIFDDPVGFYYPEGLPFPLLPYDLGTVVGRYGEPDVVYLTGSRIQSVIYPIATDTSDLDVVCIYDKFIESDAGWPHLQIRDCDYRIMDRTHIPAIKNLFGTDAHKILYRGGVTIMEKGAFLHAVNLTPVVNDNYHRRDQVESQSEYYLRRVEGRPFKPSGMTLGTAKKNIEFTNRFVEYQDALRIMASYECPITRAITF